MASLRIGQHNATIISPKTDECNDFDTLRTWCKNNSNKIKSLIYQRGGVLLRGWNLGDRNRDVSVAEIIVHDCMQLQPMEKYPKTFIDFNKRCEKLNVAPGGLIQRELSRDVPPPEDNVIQCPHTEFGIGPHRPRIVSFYVEVPPKKGTGATARCYLPDVYRKMSTELKQALIDNGWATTTIKDCIQPSILVHPETNEHCIQLYTFSRSLVDVAYEAYCQVQKTERPDLPKIDSIPYNGPHTYTMELVRPDGKTKFVLPRHLQVEFYRCLFSCIQQQYWEEGDILLFDNILYGHFRMPGTKPRKIHAIFLEEIDTRTLHRKDAPKCVLDAINDKVDGSIGGLLSQLGLGGNMIVLWILTHCIPDFWFYIFGVLFWANKKMV